MGGDRGSGQARRTVRQLELRPACHRHRRADAPTGASDHRSSLQPAAPGPARQGVPGSPTDPAIAERAVAFYAAMGKRPQLLRMEIPGFVPNRLSSALFREAVHLVSQRVVTEQELDEIVTSSI